MRDMPLLGGLDPWEDGRDVPGGAVPPQGEKDVEEQQERGLALGINVLWDLTFWDDCPVEPGVVLDLPVWKKEGGEEIPGAMAVFVKDIAWEEEGLTLSVRALGGEPKWAKEEATKRFSRERQRVHVCRNGAVACPYLGEKLYHVEELRLLPRGAVPFDYVEKPMRRERKKLLEELQDIEKRAEKEGKPEGRDKKKRRASTFASPREDFSPEEEAARRPRSTSGPGIFEVSSSSAGRPPQGHREPQNHGAVLAKTPSPRRPRRSRRKEGEAQELRRDEGCSGTSRGASQSEGPRRRRKAKEAQSQPPEEEPLEEETQRLSRQSFALPGEQQFLVSWVSAEDATEECGRCFGGSSNPRRRRRQSTDPFKSTVILLPDCRKAPDAREGQRYARARDDSSMHRSSQQREAVRSGGHLGGSLHGSRKCSPHRELERRPTFGGHSSQTCWHSSTGHHAEGPEAQPTGRSQRKEQTKRKEGVLEKPAVPAEGSAKRRRTEDLRMSPRVSAPSLSCAGSAERWGKERKAVARPSAVGACRNRPVPGREQLPLESSSLPDRNETSTVGLGASSINERCAGEMLSSPVSRMAAIDLDLASFEWPHQFGQRLAEGISHDLLPKGFYEFLNEVKHFASQDAFLRGRGIFPLPVNFEPVSSSVSSIRAPGVQAWLPLVCLAPNFLSGCKKTAPRERTGAQVKRVIAVLEDRISRFLSLFKTPLHIDPKEAWKDVTSKRLNYEGEEHADPVPLSRDQILKSLPPSGHGGSVDLLPLLVGQARHLLAHPMEVLLDWETEKRDQMLHAFTFNLVNLFLFGNPWNNEV